MGCSDSLSPLKEGTSMPDAFVTIVIDGNEDEWQGE